MTQRRLVKQENKEGEWWKKRITVLLLVFSLLVSSLLSNAPFVEAAVESSGRTYFTDTDNWGGGSGTTAADGDLDVGIKNQNKVTADNFEKTLHLQSMNRSLRSFRIVDFYNIIFIEEGLSIST